MDELLDTAPCGFISFLDDGSICEINRTLLDLLKYQADELRGSSVERLFTTASRIFYQTHFFPLIKLSGAVEEVFISLRTRSGDDVPMLGNAARKERGGTHVTDCVFIPVRQRQQYEDEILLAKRTAEEALQSNEELVRTKHELERHVRLVDAQLSRLDRRNSEMGRLTTIFSHELREPVRKISVMADLVEHEANDVLPAELLTYLARIGVACERMDRLLSALRQLIAVDLRDEDVAEVDLNALVREVADEISQRPGLPDLYVRTENLPVVEGYPRQLHLLFQHLLDNAAKFRNEDELPVISVTGTILQYNTFQSLPEKYRYVDFIRIELSDNGIGFDPKYRTYIFDPLKKLRVQDEGVGIGLSVAKKIVETHGGSIDVNSAPGSGTTFTISLPLRQQPGT